MVKVFAFEGVPAHAGNQQKKMGERLAHAEGVEDARSFRVIVVNFRTHNNFESFHGWTEELDFTNSHKLSSVEWRPEAGSETSTKRCF